MAARNGVMSPSTKGDNLKLAFGQHTTVAASDVVPTGLREVFSVVVSLDAGPDSVVGEASAAVPATGGDITIKTYDSASASPFRPAASGFGKKVNWMAVGR